MIRFAVHIGDKPKKKRAKELAIVGWRYPPSKDDPGKKENKPRDGEVRVASHLFAVIDIPSDVFPRWTQDRREGAQFIADAIPKARVVAVNLPDEKKGRRRDR